MTKQEANKLEHNQKVWYKSIYIFPEELIVDKVDVLDDKIIVNLSDGTYIPENSLEDLFSTKEECITACEKELESRVEKLRLMLKSNQ